MVSFVKVYAIHFLPTPNVLIHFCTTLEKLHQITLNLILKFILHIPIMRLIGDSLCLCMLHLSYYCSEGTVLLDRYLLDVEQQLQVDLLVHSSQLCPKSQNQSFWLV